MDQCLTIMTALRSNSDVKRPRRMPVDYSMWAPDRRQKSLAASAMQWNERGEV